MPYQFRRDDAPAFNPKEYYTIRNPNSAANSLSAGFQMDTNGGIKMVPFNTTSSENWQLFYQSGRYFIRNWDYGAKWQLGLTEESRSIPKLYPRNGSLSQQWRISKVGDGWRLVNELWGDGTVFAQPGGWEVPAMRSEMDGATWNITVNPSAAQSQPIKNDWLSVVEDFASPSPSPSSSPSSASTGPVFISSATPVASFISAPSSSTSAISSPSPTLSSGAIAGVSIAVIVFFTSIIFALWFLLIRRKDDSKNHGTPYEVEAKPVVSKKYAYTKATEMPARLVRSELANREAVFELPGR